MGSKDVQLSKALSYVLRHGAIKERLPIGPDAFIKLDLLLARPKFKAYTRFSLLFFYTSSLNRGVGGS